jgi:hypothetical protein
MKLTKKIREASKLIKEVEQEIETLQNYFIMNNKKYFLKKGNLYESNDSSISIGQIDRKGRVSIFEGKTKKKSFIIKNNKTNKNINFNENIENIEKNKIKSKSLENTDFIDSDFIENENKNQMEIINNSNNNTDFNENNVTEEMNENEKTSKNEFKQNNQDLNKDLISISNNNNSNNNNLNNSFNKPPNNSIRNSHNQNDFAYSGIDEYNTNNEIELK